MNTITLSETVYTAPSKWNELTIDQLIIWMRICAKNIEGDDALRLAVFGFYKLPKKDFFKLTKVQGIQLSFTLRFLLEEKQQLNNWIIPFIRPNFYSKYYGPANRLTTSTIKEYRYTELLYNAYMAKKDPRLLDRLIGALYREPSGSENDIRIGLSDLGVSKRARVIRELSPTLKAAILFNYEGCRNYLSARYPTIFISGKKDNKTGLPDLQGMIRNIAGGKFGNFVETEQTGLYMFLDHLKDELAENAKNRK